MWPFRRKPTEGEVDLGRKALRESQLAITQRYGWQWSQTNDQDVLRESLEHHEPALVPVVEPGPS
jgi:hypothetical protein